MSASRFPLLFLATLALSSCGGSGSTDSPSTPPPAANVTISGIATDDPLDGATVEVKDIDGVSLDTTVTDAAGRFSMEVARSSIESGFRLIVTGGQIAGDDFAGEMLADYSISDDTAAANVTPLTTLIAKISDGYSNGGLIERRNSVVSMLADIGAVSSETWHEIEPPDVNIAELRSAISRAGFEVAMEALSGDLADGDVDPVNMVFFPHAHGGLVSAVVGVANEIGNFSGAKGQEAVRLATTATEQQFVFIKSGGPDWATIDASGIINYEIPEGAAPGAAVVVSLEISNSGSGLGRTLDFQIYILAGEIIAQEVIDADGGLVSEHFGDISASFPAGAVSSPTDVTINRGFDRQGDIAVGVTVKGELQKPYQLHLPPPEVLRANAGKSAQQSITSQSSERKSEHSGLPIQSAPSVEGQLVCEQTDANYVLSNCWQKLYAYFFKQTRLPTETGSYQFWIDNDVFVEVKPASQLQSDITHDMAREEASAGTIADPVLFVHGYLPGGDFSGESKTWGSFTDLIKETHQPFEFRWRTNARFQDVANDLASAVETIAELTGKDVHIVAHSMGGILTRSMLQGLAASGSSVSDLVASVTTLGTPHSGIYDSVGGTADGIRFPDGQDDWTFIGCGALSCYQLGEDIFLTPGERRLFKLASEPGSIAANLADRENNQLPSTIPIQSLIGITINDGRNSKADAGDSLISYEGQRFFPYMTVNQSTGESKPKDEYTGLMNEHENEAGCGAGVSEKILGFSEHIKPGDPVTSANGKYSFGYRHTNSFFVKEPRLWLARGSAAEVDLECDSVDDCVHDGWKQTTEFLNGCESGTAENSMFSVTVLVTGPNGLPVRQALVTFSVNGRDIGFARNGNTITDENGIVAGELPFFSNASYLATATPFAEPQLLAASTPDYLGTGSDIPSDTSVFPTIRLVSTSLERASLSGTIRDVASGAAIPGAGFSIKKAPGDLVVASGTTPNGEYSVADLAPGMYVLTANAPGYPPKSNVSCFVDGSASTCDVSLEFDGSDTVSPTAPANFEVSAVSPSQINLTWGPSVDDVGFSHYSVYRYDSPIAEDITVTQFVDSALSPESDYCYSVTAFDLAGNSASTPETCAQTTSENTPVGVVATVGNGSAIISWDAVQGATSYNIYWSYSPEVTTDDTPISDVDSPYAHSSLTNDQAVYYVVTAVVNGVESAASAEVMVIPRDATAAAFNQVFFATERDGNWEIYAAEFPPGTAQQNLTQNVADDQLVVVSPLLDKLAFVSDRDGNSEVYKMNIDGSDPTPLTNDPGDDAPMPWSFDGSEILFVTDRNGNFDVYKSNAAGTVTTQLTSSEADDTLASWSPDAQQVTFATDRDGNKEVYSMNSDGSGMLNLTNNLAIDDIPFYSPNGQKIAFVSDRDGDFDLFTMNSDGSGLFKLTSELVDDVGWFAWSPDGSRIAYDSAVDGDYEVYVINANGTDQRKLTDNTAKDQYASWTADGSGILYVSDIDGNHEIYLVLMDGSEPVNLTNDPGDDWIPVFSPVYGTQNCFIATAAYGSYLHEDVQVLREFRDEHLLTNAPGRAIVDFYYAKSPPIASFISESELLRFFTRIGLTPVVYFVKYPIGGLIALVLVIMGGVTWRRKRRRVHAASQEAVATN